jgi:hypothetical protein
LKGYQCILAILIFQKWAANIFLLAQFLKWTSSGKVPCMFTCIILILCVYFSYGIVLEFVFFLGGIFVIEEMHRTSFSRIWTRNYVK